MALTQDISPLDQLTSSWPSWPTYGLVDDLLPKLKQWNERGERVALATLVRIACGSSPRPVGSEMAISESGNIAGYVSGGCVEGAVATEALSVLESGKPVWLDYGTGSPVFDVKLSCDGRIGIFVRPMSDLAYFIECLQCARSEREALTVAIDLNDGHEYLKSDPAPDAQLFRKTYPPANRLLLVGSDPITLALTQLAPMVGFEVGLLRPYGPDSPPETASPLFLYDNRPIKRALYDFAIDQWMAIYTLTHDVDDDHRILVRALESAAFAVGALGSRRKVAARITQLREAGVSESQVERLNTPAGLPIKANTPTEIALSIIAELVAQRPRIAVASA